MSVLSFLGEALCLNIYGSKIFLKKSLFVRIGVRGLKKKYRKSCIELPENPVSVTALSQFIKGGGHKCVKIEIIAS